MPPPILLILALTTVLRGVPSLASGLSAATVPEPAFVVDATVIMTGAAAVTVVLVGVALAISRRRRPGSQVAIEAAERRSEATDEKVAAALQRRTLSRGRLRIDDDLMSGATTPLSEDATPRGIRRSG